MENYPHNAFNDQVRRIAGMRAYEKPIEAIRHQIKLNGDTSYLRLLVVAADLFTSWAPFPMPVEPKRFGSSISGEFVARF